MKLKINSVQNAGDHLYEHLVLEVLKDTDIGKYIVFNTCSTKIIHSFWFPDMQVKEGDLIHLYTGTIPNNDLESKHCLSWGLQYPIWTNEKECAVLVEANDWNFKQFCKVA